MGALHQVRSDFSAEDEIGWAVGGGLKLNLPWAKGDTVTAQVAYAEGAMKYLGSGLSNFLIGSDGTFAYGPGVDAVWNGTDLDLSTGWSVVAGADHHWNAQWKTSLYGGYGDFSMSDDPLLPNNFGDWKFWQVGSRTVWTPVQNLDLSVDVLYNHIDTAFGDNPAFEDKGWWQGMFRVQRNFWP
jgi:hypothetical protein